MYNNPLVLGIDCKSLMGGRYQLSDLLNRYGLNTGNMFFSEALYRNLRGARRSTLNFDEREVNECDAFVIAAANWLNPYDDFGWLADRLQKYEHPVIICGLGAQTELPPVIPHLKEGTLRLLRLIAERSASISVRGAFSAEILEAYGIKNIAVTGCPSALLNGPHAPVSRGIIHPVDVSDIAVHSTRHQFWPADQLQCDLYRYAKHFGADLILQSELADMYYALGRTNNEKILECADNILCDVYKDEAGRIAKYLSMHGKTFFEIELWMQFLKSKKFVFGTRLHGTIASLLAGTPAILIVHDSRTKEVASVMNIPSVDAAGIDSFEFDAWRDLYEPQKIEIFAASFPNYTKGFGDFFRNNGLGLTDQWYQQ